MAEKKKVAKKAAPKKVSLQDLFDEFDEFYEEAKENAEKFMDKGNKSAAGRIRKNMQSMKKKAQEIRIKVMEMKKEM